MKNKTMKKLKLCVFGLLLTVVSYGQSGILSPSDEFCTITDTIYYSSTDLDSVLSWYNIKRTLCHRIINGDSTLTY